MKFTQVFLASLFATSQAAEISPIGKVLQLISDLQAKILSEGEGAQKVYSEYSEWCEDRSRDLGHSIKTATSEVESLKANIAEETSTSSALGSKIEDLAGDIATDEADLKAATEIRDKENSDFATEESELTEIISTLERAVAILEREMAKGGSSMLQNAGSLAKALSVMVQASSLSSADASRLTAFVQSQASSDEAADAAEDDADLGAPAAAVYESQSGNIVETLQGLLDKAEAQLGDIRKTETTNKQNFEMLQQSIEDEIKFGNKDMGEAKKGLAGSGEAKATAEGELESTSKDLAADTEAKGELHQACMTKAEDFEAETKSRAEELKAIAEAKKVIQEMTGGAESVEYGSASFLQVAARSQLSSFTDLKSFEVVHMVRDLARKEGSTMLSQLAQRAASAMHSRDPFAKIKGLISDMIAKMEEEKAADATKKDYCDKELSESTAKKAEKTAEIEKLSTQIDKSASRSAQLKEEVSQLQNELSALASAQASMDQIRSQEHEAFVKNKADLDQGLEGVKTALKVLNEYYASKDKAHTAASGASSGIIGLLEVCESDFAKSSAEIASAEETAAADHERETKENDVERVAKEKDVEYKGKESASLDKTVSEVTSDRSGVQAELDAVAEYLSKIEEQCIAKAESYADRTARRQSEIAGLKEALQVLESETAFVQRRASHHKGALRGHVLSATV